MLSLPRVQDFLTLHVVQTSYFLQSNPESQGKAVLFEVHSFINYVCKSISRSSLQLSQFFGSGGVIMSSASDLLSYVFELMA